jgi:hypothetical protein
MNNIKSLERQKEETISNMNPEELKAYQKLLVQRLYKSFIELNEEEALRSKRNIEETTSLVEDKYSNALEVELKLRLDEANKNLIKVLEDNKELSKYYLERIHEDYIDIIGLSNDILKALLSFYESSIPKGFKELVLDIFESIDERLKLSSFYIGLFEDEDILPNTDQEDFLINRLIEEYDEFKAIAKEIKQL